MKTANFFGFEISRLLLGDNPFNGHSYIASEHDGNEMMDFFTADRILKTMFEAESLGINAYVALADPFIIRLLRQYRNEGGKMKIIFQSYPPVDLEVNIHQMMGCDPIGIYHQGGTLDYMCEEGRFDELHSRLGLIKASGVKAGLGTHEPETLLKAEREGWGMDFYMACLYNARRTQRGQQSGFITGKPKELVFYPGDPPYMFEAIQKTAKPCIAFKIFAGGQVFSGKKPDEIPDIIKTAFEQTYANIKPCDTACIGVFQKHADQLKNDAEIASMVLDKMEN